MSEEANRLCYYCRLPMRDGFQNWHQTNHAKLTYCVEALRAALDQERADSERLRAFAREVFMRANQSNQPVGVQWLWQTGARIELLDDEYHPTALLSGRGEGR